jgi:hypothetical protein
LLIFIHLKLSLILFIIREVWTDGKIAIDLTFESLTPKTTNPIIHHAILRDIQPQANHACAGAQEAEAAKA